MASDYDQEIYRAALKEQKASMDYKPDLEPELNLVYSKVSQLSRPKSDLSKIISGIREDLLQSVQEPYDVEGILARELTNEPRRVSIIEELSDVNSSISDDEAPPPDEGFAWIIAIIAMLSVVSTWGPNSGYGVFLQYYTAHDTFAGGDMYDYALVGSMDICLAQALAPLATLLYQLFGLKITVGIGLVLQSSGYILASFSTKLWHLYLTQGVLVGTSFCLVYMPPTLILPTWFNKYKAFAFGICVSGAGVGGILYSLTINRMIQITGDQRWALRVVAFIAFVCGIPALFLKPRTKAPKPAISFSVAKHHLGLIFDSRVLRLWPLNVLAVWFCLTLLGYIVMLFSLSSYAISVGLTTKQASNITAILNVGQSIGRPLIGLTSDIFGRSNSAAALCLLISILLFTFWINAVSYASLIPFSLIIGIFIGVGSCLSQSLASNIINAPNELPAAWSYLNIMVGLVALPAEVIGLSLKNDSLSRPFLYCQIFSGSIYFFCAGLMLIIRSFLVQKALVEQLQYNQELLQVPNRYLKVEDLQQEEDEQLIQDRISRYTYLLQPGLYYFCLRMIYPLRV